MNVAPMGGLLGLPQNNGSPPQQTGSFNSGQTMQPNAQPQGGMQQQVMPQGGYQPPPYGAPQGQTPPPGYASGAPIMQPAPGDPMGAGGMPMQPQPNPGMSPGMGAPGQFGFNPGQGQFPPPGQQFHPNPGQGPWGGQVPGQRFGLFGAGSPQGGFQGQTGSFNPGQTMQPGGMGGSGPIRAPGAPTY